MSVRRAVGRFTGLDSRFAHFLLTISIAQVNRKSIGKLASQREFLQVFRAQYALEQGWAATTTEQQGVHVGDGVSTFLAAPGEEQVHLREAPRAKCKARREAVHEMIEADIAACERHFSFVKHEREAERQVPNGMFKPAAEQENVGGAKPIILIAGQRRIKVQVRAAEGRLEVKRHDVSRGRHRLRDEKPDAEASFEISRDRRTCVIVQALGAIIGTIVSAGQIGLRG